MATAPVGDVPSCLVAAPHDGAARGGDPQHNEGAHRGDGRDATGEGGVVAVGDPEADDGAEDSGSVDFVDATDWSTFEESAPDLGDEGTAPADGPGPGAGTAASGRG